MNWVKKDTRLLPFRKVIFRNYYTDYNEELRKGKPVSIFSRNEETKRIDVLIVQNAERMSLIEPSSDEYVALMKIQERLTEMKTKNRRTPVSRDTIAMIAANLAGILIIVIYEQKHVMNSKGLNQLFRPK